MKRRQYLLDTCICAYWLRDKYDVKHRVNAVGMENCYISEVTVAELKFGKVYGKLKGATFLSSPCHGANGLPVSLAHLPAANCSIFHRQNFRILADFCQERRKKVTGSDQF